MVVSLPSSLTGVVRRRQVSDYFHQRAANNSSSSSHSGRGRGGRGRYFEESTAGDKALTELFHEGQVRAQNMCNSKGWEKTVTAPAIQKKVLLRSLGYVEARCLWTLYSLSDSDLEVYSFTHRQLPSMYLDAGEAWDF